MKTVEEACKAILGEEVADEIIKDMGLHWAVAGAVAAARTTDNPQAIAILRGHLKSAGEGRGA